MSPHTLIRRFICGPFESQVIGFSLDGAQHQKEGINNQDGYSCTMANGLIALAVADGVGSCPRARTGSQLAVEVIAELASDPAVARLVQHPDEEIIVKVIKQWEAKIPGDHALYSTTLRFALLSERLIFLGHIGDGITLVRIDDKTICLNSEELFANATYALTHATDTLHMHIQRIEIPPDALQLSLFLATDGFAAELAPDTLNGFLGYITARCEDCRAAFAQELTDWANSLQEKNGDDKTMIVLYAERSL